MSLYLIDFESTGVDPWKDAPVSVALLRINHKATTTVYAGRCNPGRPIPPESTAIHGITDADAASALPWLDTARALHAHAEDVTAFAAYNAPYDFTLLFRAWRDLGLSVPRVPVLDPLVWARQVWRSNAVCIDAGLYEDVTDDSGTTTRKASRKLTTVARALGVPLDAAHDAEADAHATAGVMRILRQRIVDGRRYRGPMTLAALGEWTAREGMATDRWFLSRPDAPDDLARVRARIGSTRTGPAVDAETGWSLMLELMDDAPAVALGGAA